MRQIRSWFKWATMTFAVSLSVGCGLMAPRVVDTYCEKTFIFEPTLMDSKVVSDRLARQIVVHNNRRAKGCR